MFPGFLFTATDVITKDGGLSADYTLTAVIGLCGLLISIILTFIFNTIRSSLSLLNKDFKDFKDSISADLKDFKDDFHQFAENQRDINGRLEERTKDL